jgi:capsular polysaccharide transport system permease protein
MIDKLRSSWPAKAASQAAQWAQDWLTPALLRRRTFGMAFVASLLAVLYWGVIASNRYVSEAHVVVRNTDIGAPVGMDIAGLLSNTAVANRTDQLLLRDHLLSVDMLRKLDEKLNLRQHYSNWHRDLLSQMWLEKASIEWFYRHYLGRVEIELDEHSGVLVIKAQAYDAEMAHAIASMLVSEGELYMNEMAHQLARDQVSFLEKQVAEMSQRLIRTRTSLLEFQSANNLASPSATSEAITAITVRLEGQLAELKAKRSTMLSYLSNDAPDVVHINSQIAAVETQISLEQGRLVAPRGNGNKSLNRIVEEYQRLELEARFAQDVYQTALGALERGRLDATRNLKKVSVLQSPVMPEYPWEPRRLYNIVVFVLCVMILAGVIHLIAAIIRDHKD